MRGGLQRNALRHRSAGGEAILPAQRSERRSVLVIASPLSFRVERNIDIHRAGRRGGGQGHGWVNAGRRPHEGPGPDAVVDLYMPAKGLSANAFFGWQP